MSACMLGPWASQLSTCAGRGVLESDAVVSEPIEEINGHGRALFRAEEQAAAHRAF
jgi:hypothetical protein